MTFSSRSLNSKKDSIWNRQGQCGSYFHVCLVCECGAASAYPDDAVESVDGGEFKAQAEKVKWEDAKNINLSKNIQDRYRNVTVVVTGDTIFFNNSHSKWDRWAPDAWNRNKEKRQ